MPISEIAELVPAARNDMAVGSALHLLERAGFIQREYRQGARTYTTRLVNPVKPLDELPVDFERLDKKRERDFAKLHRMIAYAEHHGCRHHFILEYFEDTETGEGCTVCDNCLAKADSAARFPTEGETLAVQKALSCVARVNGRFGRGRIAQCLVGSRSKEVLDTRLDRLSTYGLLKELGEDYVWGLLNTLIRTGCLAVSGGQYPTLSLTELGGDIMRKTRRIPMVLPELKARPRQSQRNRTVTPSKTNEPADYDVKLFEALRVWRRERTTTMGGVPAYIIYPDRTLQELARVKPLSEAELLEVRGIGPAKARQFGIETVAVIRKFAGGKI
jgi:ATP-dependent DNA helicase RecQ